MNVFFFLYQLRIAFVLFIAYNKIIKYLCNAKRLIIHLEVAMLPISVCIIARNEEKYIKKCLERLSCYDWEIVVVDTGSTDRTVEITQEYTTKIFHFHWTNDFSAARNYSIAMASHDYILVVDCDEYLEKDDKTEYLITHLTEQISPCQVGMLNRLSPSAGDISISNSSSFSCSDRAASSSGITLVHEHIARFFNRKHTHYSGTIHEQLVSIGGKQLEFIPIPLNFYHVGYSTIITKKEKAYRNISMLESELKAKGQDSYILFQLGQSYFGLEEYEQALPYFEAALSMDVNEQEDYVQTLIESYGYCLINLKQYKRALELEGVYSVFSKRADFVFLMGLIYMNNRLFNQAITEFLKATAISEYSVEGVSSYLAFYNAGIIHECMGNKADACNCYERCGNYSPAIERLRQL